MRPRPPRLHGSRCGPDGLREDFLGALYGREAGTAALGLAVALLLETLLANPRRPG